MLRNGGGFVPKADTVIEAGDEVLLVLDPGMEGPPPRTAPPPPKPAPNARPTAPILWRPGRVV